METLMHATETKASKDHSCSFCNLKIMKGQMYMKSTHKGDGGLYDWKTHKHCDKLADKLNMYDDCDEGVTHDDFVEYVHGEYDNLLSNKFPKEELEKYSDVITELRKVKWDEKLRYVTRFYKLY